MKWKILFCLMFSLLVNLLFAQSGLKIYNHEPDESEKVWNNHHNLQLKADQFGHHLQFDKMRDTFILIIKEYPYDYTAILGLIDVCERLNNVDQSYPYVIKYEKQNPWFIDRYWLEAHYWESKNNWKRTAECLEKNVSERHHRKKDSEQNYSEWAMAYHMGRDKDNEVRVLKLMLNHFPHSNLRPRIEARIKKLRKH